MSVSPIEFSENLHIGIVDFVSPNEIKITLDIEAPDSIALNTGTPRPFPRVNSYLLIPNDDGYMVGQVEWLTIEPSPFPKRRGMMDFGLVDLPFPLRKICLNPVGILKKTLDEHSTETFVFKRGIDTFPTVGDNVLMPSQNQLRSIIESGDNLRLKIGTSVLSSNSNVYVDPDKLFGRHLAILGNTGSGKSCSVAGLIRWSLEAAFEQNVRNTGTPSNPNARFIILDPNGEYERAFSNDEGFLKPRIFKIDKVNDDFQLQVPMWFWNSAEWCSFTQASSKTQKPALLHALGNIKSHQSEEAPDFSQSIRKYIATLITTLQIDINSGAPWSSFPKPKNFFERLKKWKSGFENLPQITHEQEKAIAELNQYIEELIKPRNIQYPTYDFSKPEVDKLMRLFKKAHSTFGGGEEDFVQVDVDLPIEFDSSHLIRGLEASAELLNVSEYIETLIIRLKSLLRDTRISQLIYSDKGISLDKWLEDFIGSNEAENGCISIINLSLIPTEVINIVTAVIARMVFEALQRYRKNNESNSVFPTIMVMEEAHTYIKKYHDDVDNTDGGAICCKVFEKIAREGRKFGLGLVLSSQRPSELSSTVLSQCNTFILHRISNNNDQDLITRYVPDNLRGLLRDLPVLPSQTALLLGWASELPVLVRMRDLKKDQQPQSDDPDFWKVWSRESKRNVDWKQIANIWQGIQKKD